MVVNTGGMPYIECVIRARDVELLDKPGRDRVLEQLGIRYPEAVAAVLEDLMIPKAAELAAAGGLAGVR
jgi:hypothetical protein